MSSLQPFINFISFINVLSLCLCFFQFFNVPICRTFLFGKLLFFCKFICITNLSVVLFFGLNTGKTFLLIYVAAVIKLVTLCGYCRISISSCIFLISINFMNYAVHSIISSGMLISVFFRIRFLPWVLWCL